MGEGRRIESGVNPPLTQPTPTPPRRGSQEEWGMSEEGVGKNIP